MGRPNNSDGRIDRTTNTFPAHLDDMTDIVELVIIFQIFFQAFTGFDIGIIQGNGSDKKCCRGKKYWKKRAFDFQRSVLVLASY